MADIEQQQGEDEVPELVEVPSEAKLNELVTAANLQYKLKNYNDAADIYSRATEMQETLNGEMNPKNAELLFRYGRCLFEVAKTKSDVLGAAVAGEKKPEKKAKTEEPSASYGEGSSSALPSKDEKLAQQVVEAKVEEKGGASAPKAENKPFFQFNVVDEEEDSDEDEEGGEAEDDEDDFATAFEILDVARVLLERQLEAAIEDATAANGTSTDTGKSKDTGLETNPEVFKIKELLADTHDQQAEIALENERFHDAVTDFRAALALWTSICPPSSKLIAESHYKLSLALEFASVTVAREAQAQESGAQQAQQASQVDEEMRKEALHEMQAAIESCKLRIAMEEDELSALDGEAKSAKEKCIQDVKEMVEEMEQRLVDLREPAVSVRGGPAGAPDGSNPMAGILGQMLGESTPEQKARMEQAAKNANDLTGLVRKKKPAPAAVEPGVNGKGKRKLNDTDGGAEIDGKRAKTEELT